VHYDEPDSLESTTTHVQRETGTILLPTRRRIAIGALAHGCAPPWRRWKRGALARAERSADGRVHLVVIRAHGRAVRVTVVGVGAAEAEVLAPIAARIRRALPSRRSPALRGTTAFEDTVAALLERGASAAGRRAFHRLGAPCPPARALRTFPEPERIAAYAPGALAQTLGSALLARRLQALARTFADGAPRSPMRSWSSPAKAAFSAASDSKTAAALAGA
jgi:hypothetical protein